MMIFVHKKVVDKVDISIFCDFNAALKQVSLEKLKFSYSRFYKNKFSFLRAYTSQQLCGMYHEVLLNLLL